MRRRLLCTLAGLAASGLVVSPLWAHPDTAPHQHAGELLLLVVFCAAGIAMLALTRSAGRKI